MPQDRYQPESSVDDGNALHSGPRLSVASSSGPTAGQLDARLDHVAVAVPSAAEALVRWRDALGAGFAGGTRRDGFMTSQWRYRNGAKLELIEPDPDYPPEEVYLNGFLARYGARIHHVTFKIPDLDASLEVLRQTGIEPIGINREPLFEEAYGGGREAVALEELTGMRFPILREAYVSSSRSRAEQEAGRYIRDEYLHYSGYDLEYFDTMFEDLRRKAFLWGSPDDIAAGIETLARGGFDHFMFRISWVGMPFSLTMKSLEIMAREVLPRYFRNPPPHNSL